MAGIGEVRGSTAYGSINNFDVVNDTGHECHGFEIELEDLDSTEITYTFDWNHYGKSKCVRGTTAAGKPATFVRWESAKNANGTWAAFTAIPAGPIAPTDGHQFTNPNVNFGGEHFGVGYRRNPTAVRYFWLLADATGALVRGPEVQISTPVFNYAPPGAGVVAQVQAVIVPPVPEAPPPKEFGDPMWVKEIRTTTHNAEKVKLRDLVSDDPNDPNDPNWRNGEPDEVEVEWQLLQTDYNKGDGGANGALAAAPEGLDNGNEVVTRRYEFFKYTGPIDDETGEAKADNVGPDGIHGDGVKTIGGVEVDLSMVEVVGDYIGAQMAAFDANGEVGLIDQVPDGELNAEYPARTVIISGAGPFTATTQGELPAGMDFDTVTGVLSGTPAEAGTFSLTVNAQEGAAPVKTKTYSFIITAGGVEPPAQSVVDTSSSPAAGGSTVGGGTYLNGTNITVSATANAGYRFVNWSDNGAIVSNAASYTFVTTVNRVLVANFVAVHTIATSAAPANLGSTSGGGIFDAGASVTVVAVANAGATFVNWTEAGAEVSTAASYTFTATASRSLVANFVPVNVTIATSAAPVNGGVLSGGGTVASGTAVTLHATANAGYAFVNWAENGAEVSTSPAYSFTATADRTLVAQFAASFTVGTNASPIQGGTTAGGGAFASGANVTVTATPAAGFSFVSWTEGGTIVSTTPAYTFTVGGSRALVANFQQVTTPVFAAGTYQGLVGTPVTATVRTGGLITLTTVPGTRTVSGSLVLGEKKTSLRAVVDSVGHAQIVLRRSGASALTVDLQFAEANGFAGTIADGANTTAFAARPCPYSAANPLAEWPGDFTHLIGFPRHLRPPLPVGTGTHKITSRGAVRIVGKLSDGTSYSTSSLVTDANHFALYDATKLAGQPGFVLGEITLANTGSIDSGSPMRWKPANAQPAGRFDFHFDRYNKPARGTTVLPADPGVHNLNVMAFNPIGGLLGGWQMILPPTNVATDLGTGPGPISLRIAAKDGVISGKLTDGTVVRPFTGIVWQSTGAGFAIVPGTSDTISLQIQAIYTGP